MENKYYSKVEFKANRNKENEYQITPIREVRNDLLILNINLTSVYIPYLKLIKDKLVDKYQIDEEQIHYQDIAYENNLKNKSANNKLKSFHKFILISDPLEIYADTECKNIDDLWAIRKPRKLTDKGAFIERDGEELKVIEELNNIHQKQSHLLKTNTILADKNSGLSIVYFSPRNDVLFDKQAFYISELINKK